MLSGHSLSKITQENLEVFIDVWDTQLDELSSLLKNITQNGKNESKSQNKFGKILQL